MAHSRSILFTLTTLFLINCTVFGQDSKEHLYYSNNEQKWLIEIPIWIPGFRGQFAFGEINLSSDDESSDRESKRISNDLGLEFFFIGRGAFRFDHYWAHIDGFSGKISSKVSYDEIVGNSEPVLLDLLIQLRVSRINAGYSIWQISNQRDTKFEVIPYIGLRFHNAILDAAILDSIYSGNVYSTWIDPIIGIYLPLSYKRFRFNIQADVGGSNSKKSWMIFSQVQYKISKLIDIKFGWTRLDLKYETTVNGKNLYLDMILTGPSTGVGFRF